MTSKTTKNRRFRLYFPGLLSLLLLFPLLLFWMYKHRIFEKQMVLEVTWHDAKDTSRFFMPFPPQRKFTAVQFTGQTLNDKRQLTLLQNLVKDFKQTADTTTGVKINFHDTSKYESFVQVLNICDREGVRYIAHE